MRGKVVAAGGAVLCAVVLVPATSGYANTVTSGPLSLSLEDSTFFVKGTQETLNDFCGAGWPIYQGAHIRQQIRATSTSAITGYDVWQDYGGTGLEGPTHYTGATPPAVFYDHTNYPDDCGGGVHNYVQTQVTAYDVAGHQATAAVESRISFMRWDNSTINSSESNVFGAWSHGAGWNREGCGTCDGGAQIATKTAGATMSFKLNAVPTGSTTTGEHLGLIMTKGPGRGKVKIYLDGVLVTTYDTYASTVQYRMVVWDIPILNPNVAHTVKLVNVAPSGRPKIEVQAMGLLYGSPVAVQ